MKAPVWRLFLTSPVLWLATGFGAGLSPWAPGTVGTALGILIFLGLLHVSMATYLLLVVLGFALGTWLCSVAARVLDEHDHPAVVWDEVIGYLLTMLPVIWLHLPATSPVLLAGFVLFRVFDILKPWPISWVDQRMTNGFGGMADDALAGLAAAVVLRLGLAFAG